MGPGDLILRLVAAALLGSLIGLERQRLDKAAGLRTHMLVSVGSALIMIVSAYGFDRVIDPGRIVLDPSRVAAQVVSGIGFLGAGTIVVRKQSVHGLTTAASVWAVSAIGLAAGGALYLAAAAGTATMLVILAVIKPIEDRLLGHGHGERKTLTLTVTEPVRPGADRAPIPRGRPGNHRPPRPPGREGRRARGRGLLRRGHGRRGPEAGGRAPGYRRACARSSSRDR